MNTVKAVCLLLVELLPTRLGVLFFFQAEDGIRDLVRSLGLGDVYKRQPWNSPQATFGPRARTGASFSGAWTRATTPCCGCACLLYTSDAADERSSVDLGGRRIIKKTNQAE